MVGPAYASLASPGYGALPFINGNNAAFGGGISAQALDSSDVNVDLFTVDPFHPVALAGNFASQARGNAPASSGSESRARNSHAEARVPRAQGWGNRSPT